MIWPWKKKQKEKFDPTINYWLNFSTSDGEIYYIVIDETISAEDFYHIFSLLIFLYEYDIDNESCLSFAQQKNIRKFLFTDEELYENKKL